MNRPLPPASMQDPQENADGLEFPGCHPKRIPRSEIASYEGRIEYWDRDTETAMVCEPTTTYHERPAQALAQLAALIGAVRGSPIETFGTCDLLLRDGEGERWRILQADQTVFLHPATARPQGAAIEVLGGHLPDVVLEVDHSTDSRGGKLSLYYDWGFAEAWIEVPETGNARRPGARMPGLTIYLRQAGGWQESGASRAFPGWHAHEIHRAMNEGSFSRRTLAAVARVGKALGDRDGTAPSEGPVSDAVGRPVRDAAVRRVFAHRGLTLSQEPLAALGDKSVDEAVGAALSCRDETDFLLRLSPDFAHP